MTFVKVNITFIVDAFEFLIIFEGTGRILTEEQGGGCGHAWQTCCLPPEHTTSSHSQSDATSQHSTSPDTTANPSSSSPATQTTDNPTLLPGNTRFCTVLSKYVKLWTCRKSHTLCFCTLKFLSWCLYQTPKIWWNIILDVCLCFDMYITQWDNIPMHPIEPGIVPSSWLKSMLFPIITRRGKTSKTAICVVIQRLCFWPLLIREKSWWDAIHKTKTFRWKAAVHLSNMCGMASKTNPPWIIQLGMVQIPDLPHINKWFGGLARLYITKITAFQMWWQNFVFLMKFCFMS